MFGTCFNIPVLSLAMEFRCYKKLNKKEPLVWEDDSLLVQNINGLFSAIKVAGIIGLSVLCMIGVTKDSLKPNNRQGVTIEQFAENYNYLYETYGFENGVWDPIQLNEDGTWERTHTYPDGSTGESDEVKYYKDFVYEMKEGKIVGIEWNHALPDVGGSEGGSKEILLTCLALIEGNGGLQKNTDQFISELMNQMMQSFELYQDGYKITYELKEHTNLDYIQSSGIWFCTNNESGSLEFNFSIVKID